MADSAAGQSGTASRPPAGSGGHAPGGGTAAAAGSPGRGAAVPGFDATAAAAAAAAQHKPPRESLVAQVQGLLRELPGLLSDRVELLSLELRRAGAALVKVVVLVLAAAILGVTAWLVLWAALVGGLIALGLHWSAALLVVLLINLVAIGAALLWAKRLLPMLQMPATRRHLAPTPSPRPHVGTDVPPAARPQPVTPVAPSA